MDPAAKGCTDDLKSAKSSRGVRRPNSEGSSMTNQRRMHRVSFGCWKRHCAAPLRTEGMSFLIAVLDILTRALQRFGKWRAKMYRWMHKSWNALL